MTTHLLYGAAGFAGGALNETALAEDVANAPLRLFPEEANLTAALGTRPMQSVFQQFPVDTMARVTRSTNQFSVNGYTGISGIAVAEGDTFTDGTPRYKQKLTSVAEIQNVADSITGTQQAVNIHGFPNRLMTIVQELMRKVVQDKEWSNWWSPGTPAVGSDLDSAGGVYTARQQMGVGQWIMQGGLQRTKIGTGSTFTDAHGNVFGSGTTNVPTDLLTWCKDLAGADLDASAFFEMMLNAQQLGFEPNGCQVWASPLVRRLITKFANTAQGAINNRMVSAESKILVDTLSIYETDYGLHDLRWAPRVLGQAGLSQTISQSTGTTTVSMNSVCFCIMPEAYKQGLLRPTQLIYVPVTGDKQQVAVVQEKGLICANPIGGCGLVNAANVTA